MLPLTTHLSVAKLPSHDGNGFLPDFIGNPAGNCRSPFLITSKHLVEVYGGTDHRRDLLKQFFEYRARIRAANVTAVQWLNGSFIGDVEQREGRCPNDIDVVTWVRFVTSQKDAKAGDPALWNRKAVKEKHKLDALAFQANQPDPFIAISWACYYHGLWSRSRTSDQPLMKGYVALNLDGSDADDKAALVLISKATQ